MTWKTEDVELDDLFVSDGGLLYKVIALVDEPLAVLVPADERDGEEREHHVISSPLFATWQKVQLQSATGAISTRAAGYMST